MNACRLRPHGELDPIAIFQKEFKFTPRANVLFEDGRGHLWLGEVPMDSTRYRPDTSKLEPASPVKALMWFMEMAEVSDEWQGDAADLVRIALAEIQHRSKRKEAA